MPVDRRSGMFFEWCVNADGERFRDFSMSVDDRFEEDPATGEWIQVRKKASGRRYDDDDGPAPWPDEAAAESIDVIARWSADPDQRPEDEQTLGKQAPVDDRRSKIRRDKVDAARGPPPRPKKSLPRPVWQPWRGEYPTALMNQHKAVGENNPHRDFCNPRFSGSGVVRPKSGAAPAGNCGCGHPSTRGRKPAK